MSAERTDVRVDGPRCPYCHDHVASADPKQGCGVCMAWHHAECWRELNHVCGSCGFTRPAERPEPVERAPEVRPTEAPRQAGVAWASTPAQLGLRCGVVSALLGVVIGVNWGWEGVFAGVMVAALVGWLVYEGAKPAGRSREQRGRSRGATPRPAGLCTFCERKAAAAGLCEEHRARVEEQGRNLRRRIGPE